MGLEGGRLGPAGDRLHHRGFDLQEVPLQEKRADVLNDPAAPDEDLPHLGVHDEVDVALAVTLLRVLEPVEFFRKRPHGLGDQPHAFGQYRPLPGARLEQGAGHPHEIAHVQLLEEGEGLIPDAVLADVGLHLAGAVADPDEGGFAEMVDGHHAAGDGKNRPGLGQGLRGGVDDRLKLPDRVQPLEVVGIQRYLAALQRFDFLVTFL